MTKPLFDRRYVYPSDSYGGAYVDLEGPVVESTPLDMTVQALTVQTEHGPYKGYLPESWMGESYNGYHARIRVYDCGGGWYPDHRIISLWKP